MTNVLFMTATPILEHSLFLFSVKWMYLQLNNYQKGKPIKTSWAKHEQYDQVLAQMSNELKR